MRSARRAQVGGKGNVWPILPQVGEAGRGSHADARCGRGRGVRPQVCVGGADRVLVLDIEAARALPLPVHRALRRVLGGSDTARRGVDHAHVRLLRARGRQRQPAPHRRVGANLNTLARLDARADANAARGVTRSRISSIVASCSVRSGAGHESPGTSSGYLRSASRKLARKRCSPSTRRQSMRPRSMRASRSPSPKSGHRHESGPGPARASRRSRAAPAACGRARHAGRRRARGALRRRVRPR